MAPQDPTPEPTPDAVEYIAKIRARLDAMSPEERAALDAEVDEMCRQIDGEERLIQAIFGVPSSQVRAPQVHMSEGLAYLEKRYNGQHPRVSEVFEGSLRNEGGARRGRTSPRPRHFPVGPPYPNEEGRSED